MIEFPHIPRADDAERSVLGVIFVAPERLSVAAEKLTPDDFHHNLYRTIFEATIRLDAEHRPIDELTVADQLDKDEEFRAAGGMAFLSSLGDGVYARAPLGEYCRIVKDTAQRRALQRLVGGISKEVEGCAVGTEELIERAELGLATLREETIGASRGAVHIAEIVHEVRPILDRVGAGKGIMLGTSTGFPDLDHLTAGWIAGEMVVLAGRPSTGKSALGAGDFPLRQARQGNAVVIFSLEMSRTLVLLRLACRDARVSYHKLCSGWLSSGDVSELCAALVRITLLPIWIDDRAATSAYEIRWRLRLLAQRHSIKLAVIDYLQLLRAKAENRTQEITKISIELKAAAKELGEISGGTLLVVSQLNRMAASVRPQLHHLRESGQIEQDADTVLLLSDDEPSELGQPNPTIKILEVAKQRNGPCDCVRLMFLPAVMGFEPAASRDMAHDCKSDPPGGNS